MTNSDNDDKTRIAPRPSPTSNNNANDAEQKKARDSQAEKTVLKRKLSEEEKKQVLAARLRAAQKKKAADDKTRFMPGKIPAASAGDKTQFMRTQVQARDEDKTKAKQAADAEWIKQGGNAAANTAREQVQAAIRSSAHGLLKKRFVLEEVLGAGGMGVVYKAKDLLKIEAQDRDPYVAVKVLGEEFKAHPEAFIALQRESRKSQRIAHPNIVNVFDFDRDGDTVFMTMEFLDGVSLDKLISQYRATGLPHDDAWKILEGICSALLHAHNENIIHSDFKPGNIFFTNKGVAKVFDFGIARAVARAEQFESSVDDKTVFDAGSLGALTPAYASLEMLEGETPDVRDDIYALGCITYELFTGEHPYQRENAFEAAQKKLRPKRIPGLTRRQWRAIERAIAFKREDRIATVDDYWRELSEKKASSTLFVGGILVLLMAIAGGTWYLQTQANDSGFREDEVRGEIEYALRLELQKEAIDALMADRRFDVGWEREIWQQIQAARKLVGEEDAWLLGVEDVLYNAYLENIRQALEDVKLERAQTLLTNAARYTKNNAELVMLQQKLAEAQIAQQKALEEQQRQARAAEQEQKQVVAQQREIAKQRSEFEAAVANVNEQLTCRSNINMKDLGIAVDKLRSLDMQRYRKEEPVFVNNLAACLEKMGKNFPERAEDAKKSALHIFDNNSVIANISIVPRDPCSTSIAGLGARSNRASCRDRIALLGKGPELVVVPRHQALGYFAIGKYEITRAEINEYCAASKSCEKLAGDASLPATNISLNFANQYTRWLSEKTGKTYRLPTRDEWFYAAKANKTVLDDNRNCTLSTRGINKGEELLNASVGKKNAWGLVNHIGNAREWVREKGGGTRVLGAAHNTPMQSCNFDYDEAHSGDADPYTGFRVLREMSISG